MKKPTVLLADDHRVVAEGLRGLLDPHYEVIGIVSDGRELLTSAKALDPDVIVLDVMLPDIDGFTLCRKIREFSHVPIVMLTARGDVTDRIVGLDLGADDYLPKPFEPRELAARMQAVLRRGAADRSEEKVRIGSLDLNWATRSAHLDGRDLGLTTAEFELLGLLVRNRSRVLSRDRIINEIRGIDWEAYDRSIDVLISRLRQKLGDDPRSPVFIRTVRGAGYLFIGGAHE